MHDLPPLTDRYPLPVLPAEPSAPALWQSVAERRGEAPPADGGEFAPGVDLAPEGLERRTLLQLAAASLAAAGLTGCFRQPPEEARPYTRTPEGLVPGQPLHFATGLVLDGFTTGLVVASREGRPLKVDGNPAHPDSGGRALAQEQASLLGLYDPGRARTARGPEGRLSREALLGFLAERARALGTGAGLRLLVEPTASPLLADVYARILRRFPDARLVPFAARHAGTGPEEGARLAFGRPLHALPDFTKARVVVTLDADVLTERPGALRANRELARARVESPDLRLYAAEPRYTLTGAYADERLRVRPSRVERLARALAAEIARGAGPLAAAGTLEAQGLSEAEARWVRAAARDLLGARGAGLVLTGAHQPPRLHALAHALNAQLGNLGTSVRLFEPLLTPLPTPGALEALVGEMRAGKVDTLLVTAWNPAYTAPADVDFAGALARVPHAVYRGLHEDETARRCGWFAAATHPFESWGDGRGLDGTASILQPLIAPLFDGSVHELELLAPFVGGEPKSPHDALKDFWRAQQGGPPDFQARWEGWLADGVVPGTAAPTVPPPALDTRALAAALSQPVPPTPEGLELELVLDTKVQDGRFGDNAWLQELPEPMTQLTWGNAALLSPATADRLGVRQGARVRLAVGERAVEAPVLLAPGHAEDTVTLALGYGRRAGGTVAEAVGTDAYALSTSQAPWGGPGLTLTRRGGTEPLALRQLHGSMEGRPIALQVARGELGLLEERLKRETEDAPHLYPSLVREGGHRWGMAIDLHRCTGCSACVVACQAENNVPTVGKAGVLRGREMHWLRIDRYFMGGESDPGVIHQPLMCVHCEYAPCEYVCPVNATVHSDEGLNEMVYNRCIGTRYCSNNCPYKVRRFNFLDYRARTGSLERLQLNPEVSVRSRGVMEKCTYCVQRIEGARRQARIERRPIREGEVRTACQETCPTDAIVFGDLNHADAEVTRRHADARHYRLLDELGTKPRTVHLVRVKNPGEVKG